MDCLWLQLPEGFHSLSGFSVCVSSLCETNWFVPSDGLLRITLSINSCHEWSENYKKTDVDLIRTAVKKTVQYTVWIQNKISDKTIWTKLTCNFKRYHIDSLAHQNNPITLQELSEFFMCTVKLISKNTLLLLLCLMTSFQIMLSKDKVPLCY